MRRTECRWVGLAAAVLALGLAPAAAQPPLPPQSPHRTVGTVNCASSTCHGSITGQEGNDVLLNEYTTWLRLDRHTQAWQGLRTPLAKEMSRKLGLPRGAEHAPECLACHSHQPPAALRGARHVVSEGVGCEACHGPAGDWIGPHVEAEATHAGNLAHGLYPTDQPLAQARLCLSCHFGDEHRFVTHRMMGAGHPRLSFELATFTALEPAHFRIDADYLQRKGAWEGARVWAVGQSVAARQLLDALVDPKRGRVGPFPELVLFDCYSCHHPMSDKQWTPRLGVGPGAIRLNDSSLLMLRALVRALLPAASARFNQAVHATHLAVATGEAPAGEDYLSLAAGLSRRITALVPTLENTRYTHTVLRRILVGLLDEAGESSFSDYAGAEQACMAVSNLTNDLIAAGALRDDASLRHALDALFDTLVEDEKYQPERFKAALQPLKARVTDAT